MQLIACPTCHAQYDVSLVIVDRFDCRCGASLENEPPKPADAEIHRYGLRRPDATAELFHEKGVTARRVRATTLAKSTAEVISAVSIDPQAIAYVNFAQIPAANEAVKVLAIGPADKAVPPTAQTILDGSYPLGERLTLYVSPKAGEMARDFVKFIVSGGCASAFGPHGLVMPPREPATRPSQEAQAVVE